MFKLHKSLAICFCLFTSLQSFSQKNIGESVVEMTVADESLNKGSKTFYSLIAALNAYKRGEKVESLDLSTSIASDTTIFLFTNLKHLSIRSCINSSVISKIGWFKNLETLSISRCDNLTTLPENMAELHQLVSISFFDLKNLKTLPVQMLKLPKLAGIYLDNLPNLQEIPFQKQNGISFLHIENCDMFSFPKAIQFDSLTSIHIIDCKSINDSLLFAALQQSTLLQTIRFHNCNINTIPKTFANLINLESFESYNNPLTDIQTSFDHFSKLKFFDIYGSKITKMPVSFAALPAIERLYLADNLSINYVDLCNVLSKTKIKNLEIRLPVSFEIPETIGNIASLEVLVLVADVTAVPESILKLTNLKRISLISKNPGTLPQAIGTLPNLTDIDLRGLKINELPSSIWRIKTEEFDFSSLSLQAIPPVADTNYTTTRLILQGNKIKELPPSISKFVNLEQLHIDMNMMKKLPVSLKSMKNLQVLGLCNLPNLDLKQAFDVMKELKALRRIDISESDFTKLPKNAFECKQIEQITVLDNGCENITNRSFMSMNDIKNVKTHKALSVVDDSFETTCLNDTSTYQLKYIYSGNELTDVAKSGTKLYCTTKSQGLIIYDYKTKTSTVYNTFNSNIPCNGFDKIAVKNNIVWLVNKLVSYRELKITRFDGTTWKTITIPDNKLSYKSMNITHIAADKNNDAWIRTYDVLFQIKDTSIGYVSSSDATFPFEKIGYSGSLYPDNDGNIWISSNTKLCKLTTENKWIVYDSIYKSRKHYQTTYGLAQNKQNKLYAINGNNDIVTLEPNGWQSFDDNSQCLQYSSTSIAFADNDSVIVTASNNKINARKGKNCTTISYIESGDFVKIFCSADTIWEASNKNVYQYSVRNSEKIKIPFCTSVLDNNKIEDIITTADKAYLTTKTIVYVYKNGVLDSLPKPPFASIKKLAIDEKGVVYAAGYGLAKYENDKWTGLLPGSFFYTGPIESVFCSKNNTIWIGLRNMIAQFDGVKWQFYQLSDFGLKEDYVYDISEDDRGAILIVTSSSLLKFTNGKVSIIKENGLSNKSDIKILEKDRAKKLWLGMRDIMFGEYTYSGEYTFMKPKTYYGYPMVDMKFSDDNTLWMASQSKICAYKDGSFQSSEFINKQLDGTSINTIGILKNEVLVGTDAGIFIFKKDK